MFGRLMIEPVVQVDPTMDLQTAVATLIKITENVEIFRWIELPASFLLFLLVPGDPDSGAVYVLDGKRDYNICGSLMVRSRTCYRCMTCGSTTSCS